MRCSRETTSLRRFRTMSGSYFALQCPKCFSRVGRKLDPMDLPMHPRTVRWAERKKGSTGLGGDGNAKRQKLSAYYRSAAWKRKRAQVLNRDHFTCMSCGEPGDQVHHLKYPNELGTEPLSDLATSCKECNLEERTQRVTRSVLGA